MSLHQLSSLLTESNKTSTSGAGPMRSNIKLPLALAGLLVLTPTTGSYLPPELIRTKIAFEQTNTGLQIPKSQSTGTSIMELRRLSGLTTDQLARIFNVDRRSLHFWASGKRLNAANEERLQRLLTTSRKIDRGRARENRPALLASQEDGNIPFDLLAKEKFDSVIKLLGEGPQRRQYKFSPHSAEAKATRIPPKPELLVNALQDSIHSDVGKGRAAKSVKIKT